MLSSSYLQCGKGVADKMELQDMDAPTLHMQKQNNNVSSFKFLYFHTIAIIT